MPALLPIAVPLIAAYLAEYAMLLTTKAVVGRLGYRELAAVGLAGDITFEVLVVGIGMLSVVGVLVAQAASGGRYSDVAHATRQGLVVAALVAVPASVLVWHLDILLAPSGQDPEVLALTGPYLFAVTGAVLPKLWFAVLRSFVAGLARTAVIMVITVAAVGLNYALTLGLVHGRFGLPALGLAGAGWSTTIVSWGMLGALVCYIYRCEALRGMGLFRTRLRIDPLVCREIVRLGLPVAVLVALESGLFMAVSVLSGVLGAVPLAAHQIVIGWVAMPFVIALGLAEATMVRVAYGMGRGDRVAARAAGVTGLVAGILVLGALVVVPLGWPERIVAVFLDPGDPGFAEVSALAVRLLVVAAIFQVFDGIQAIASRALRACRDTLVPLWMATFGYWVLGIGGGAFAAFALGYGAAGLWWGLATGLIVTAGLLSFRFLRLTRAMPAAPAP